MQSTARVFDFYYGNEGDQFSYFRVPKYLFDDPYFSSLSQEAIILYSLMQDRMSLSSKNDWRDENGRVYIRYSRDEIEKDLNLGHTKASAVIKELISIGLIERKILGQGKVSNIFVKNFARFLGNIQESITDNAGSDDHRIFEYFYGNEGSQFRHFIIPKILFDDEYFSGLRLEAKILYSRMLDRMYLSVKKEWIDKQGRVFIYYSNEEMGTDLNRKRDTIITILKELESVGLIERKKQGQGRPTAIYVKNFVRCIFSKSVKTDESIKENRNEKPEKIVDCRNSAIKKSEKRTSRSRKNGRQEVGKADVKTSEKRTPRTPGNGRQDIGKTDTNNPYWSDPYFNDPSINHNEDGLTDSKDIDELELYNALKDEVRNNLSYDSLIKDEGLTNRGLLINMVDWITVLLWEAVNSKNGKVRIGMSEYPADMVIEKFSVLRRDHLDLVIKSVEGQDIRSNRRNYYLKALLNVPVSFEKEKSRSLIDLAIDKRNKERNENHE